MAWDVHLVGYLRPDSWWLGRHELPDLHDPIRQRRLGTISFSARGGVLVVDGSFEDNFQIDDASLRSTVERLVQAFVSAFAVRDGSGFDLRITHIDRGTGIQAFDSHFPNLAAIELDVAQAQRHLGHNLALREAVGEFAEAINRSDATARLCYRGVEAIRNHFGTGTAQGWNQMHHALHTEEGFFRSLTDAAQGQRHAETPGDLRVATTEALERSSVSAENRRVHLSILRLLIERFVAWLQAQEDGRDFFPEPLTASSLEDSLRIKLEPSERTVD